jgi:hypothetical protein
MVIVRIIGGLGNQMFQYALYKNLTKKCKNVKCDIIGFDNYKLHTGFELENIFDVTINKATLKEVNDITNIYSKNIFTKVKRKLIGNSPNHLHESEFTWDTIETKNNLYLDGYWQNDSFFGDSNLLKDFSFKQKLNDENIKLIDTINSCNSVSIHIRRGDYVGNSVYTLCDELYYKKAIAHLQSQKNDLVLFVFSNDMNWVRNILIPYLDTDLNVFFVENNNSNPSVDMRLMSLCKANIISNSSFSWWGAWLNRNKEKIVIAPSKWYRNIIQNSEQIKNLPKSWLTI